MTLMDVYEELGLDYYSDKNLSLLKIENYLKKNPK